MRWRDMVQPYHASTCFPIGINGRSGWDHTVLSFFKGKIYNSIKEVHSCKGERKKETNVCMCVCRWTHMPACVCMCMDVRACACMCVHVPACRWTNVCVCLWVCVSVSLSVCVCQQACVPRTVIRLLRWWPGRPTGWGQPLVPALWHGSSALHSSTHTHTHKQTQT